MADQYAAYDSPKVRRVLPGRTIGACRLEVEFKGTGSKAAGAGPKDAAAAFVEGEGCAHLVGLQCGTKGQRDYAAVRTTDELVALLEGCRDRSQIRPDANCVYELIDSGLSRAACRLYADIDVKGLPAGLDDAQLADLHHRHLRAAAATLRTAVQRTFGVRLEPHDLFVTQACTRRKSSFHIVVHRRLSRELRLVWRKHVAPGLGAGIDPAPYGKSNNMRAIYQQKVGEDNPLLPYCCPGVAGNASTDPRDYLISYFARCNELELALALTLPPQLRRKADTDLRFERKRQKAAAGAGGAGGSGAGVPHQLIALAKAMAVRELGTSYESCTLREWNAATNEAKFQTNNAPRACPAGTKGHGAATTTNGFILKIDRGVVYYNCAYTACQHKQRLGSYAVTAREVFRGL